MGTLLDWVFWLIVWPAIFYWLGTRNALKPWIDMVRSKVKL